MTTDEPTSLPDVNVLVALTNPSHVHHEASRKWLAEVSAWATTPVTESALLRLLLNPAVVGQQVDRATAVAVVSGVRAASGRFVADNTSVVDSVVDLAGLAGSKQVTDFHLVNLAAVNDAVLVTFDRRITTYLSPGDQRFVQVLTG